MPERASATLRWSRALLLAAVAFGLGLVGHLAAGGLVPGPTGLLALYAVTAIACAALLGRPASALRITALVVAGQAAIHTVLTAAAGAGRWLLIGGIGGWLGFLIVSRLILLVDRVGFLLGDWLGLAT